MQGFVNLADDIGQAISVIIPALCYIIGWSFLLGAGWGMWQLSSGRHGRLSARPWMPFVTLFIGAALLTFDRMLNLGEATLGSAQQASMAAAMTSYTPPTVNGNGLVGSSPEQTILNVINVFQYFFVSYGALIVLMGILGLHQVSEGKRRHGPSLPVVMIVFGFGVMNVETIASAIMSYFA
jgi:uncharacterized membrane protein